MDANKKNRAHALQRATDYARKGNYKETKRWLDVARMKGAVSPQRVAALHRLFMDAQKVELHCQDCERRYGSHLHSYSRFHVMAKELREAGGFIRCEYCGNPCAPEGQEVVCRCGHKWGEHNRDGEGVCSLPMCECYHPEYIVLESKTADGLRMAKEAAGYAKAKYVEFADLYGVKDG